MQEGTLGSPSRTFWMVVLSKWRPPLDQALVHLALGTGTGAGQEWRPP